MPKAKTKCRKRKQMYSMKDDTMNLSLMEADSRIIDDIKFKKEMWKVQVKEKIKDALTKLKEQKMEADDSFELYFNNLLMGISKNILNLQIDINNEKFRDIILSINESDKHEIENKDDEPKTPTPSPEKKAFSTKWRNNDNDNDNDSRAYSPSPEKKAFGTRRRSRSVNIGKPSTRGSRLRFNSIDVYKTPTGRVRLSSIMSHKKYTVMKPAKSINSGLNVKRIMKPDEIAISTCGSPLYVASSSLGAPHINIPLPGGVVLNIEPKEPEGPMEVPGLDVKTKNQLKILCEQLKKLF